MPSNTPATGRPRVSVALCTYNGETYLREQLDSILRQTSSVQEIVVADDASSDRTREILTGYQQQFPELFRLYFHQSGLGTVKNFEFALQQCTGDLIFLCDQDDEWHHGKVAVMVRRFADRRCLLLFTDGALIDPAGALLGSTLWQKWGFTRWRRFTWRWRPGAALRDLLYNNNKVTGATVAIRRSLLQHAIPILVPHGYWHDAWFAMHAAAHRGLAFIPQKLIRYRVHPKQQVGLTRGGETGNSEGVCWPEFLESFRRQYPGDAFLVDKPRFADGLRTRLRSLLQ